MSAYQLKRIFALLCLALSVTTSANAAEPPALQHANAFSLQSYQGSVVYLDFWASWCGPCKQSFPFMQALQAKYKEQGLRIVAVNVDAETTDAKDFLKDYGVNFDVVLDPNGMLAERFQIIGMPSSYLISRRGQTITSHVGFLEKDKQQIEQKIIRALEDSHS